MISPEDIKILHLPLAWWRRGELCLGQLEIKPFQAYNIYCSPWGWLRMWATQFWWNGTGEDSRASTSALYLWVSSEKLYWIHILQSSPERVQLTFAISFSLAFSSWFYLCVVYLCITWKGFGEGSLQVWGTGRWSPIGIGRENGAPTLGARSGAGLSLLPVTSPCFPPPKETGEVLALHKGDLPRLLALLAACQDVLLPPFRPPLKGTQYPQWEVLGSLESGSSPLQQVRGLRISFQTGKRKQYLESFRKASTSRGESGSIKCFLSLSVFPCKIKCGWKIDTKWKWLQLCLKNHQSRAL